MKKLHIFLCGLILTAVSAISGIYGQWGFLNSLFAIMGVTMMCVILDKNERPENYYDNKRTNEKL